MNPIASYILGVLTLPTILVLWFKLGPYLLGKPKSFQVSNQRKLQDLLVEISNRNKNSKIKIQIASCNLEFRIETILKKNGNRNLILHIWFNKRTREYEKEIIDIFTQQSCIIKKYYSPQKQVLSKIQLVYENYSRIELSSIANSIHAFIILFCDNYTGIAEYEL